MTPLRQTFQVEFGFCRVINRNCDHDSRDLARSLWFGIAFDLYCLPKPSAAFGEAKDCSTRESFTTCSIRIGYHISETEGSL
jgi:hypothetical protein